MNINVNDEREFIGQIIDIFEDFLTDRGVEIDNDARDEAMCEDNSIEYVNIFGDDYDELENLLQELIENWSR